MSLIDKWKAVIINRGKISDFFLQYKKYLMNFADLSKIFSFKVLSFEQSKTDNKLNKR